MVTGDVVQKFFKTLFAVGEQRQAEGEIVPLSVTSCSSEPGEYGSVRNLTYIIICQFSYLEVRCLVKSLIDCHNLMASLPEENE